MREKRRYAYPSPCLNCTRVPNPRRCENKLCKPWQRWFIDRWDTLRQGVRAQMDTAEPEPYGVSVGGRRYAPPDQVREYLAKDPCEDCLCPKDLCTGPCRLRRRWEEARGGVAL